MKEAKHYRDVIAGAHRMRREKGTRDDVKVAKKSDAGHFFIKIVGSVAGN